MILRICTFACYKWRKNEFHTAHQTVNRWQKITIIYQVVLGLRKQPGIQRHWILLKKTYFTYCFFIIQAVLHESIKLAIIWTSFYSSLCFCTHDNVEYISDLWLLYAVERLTSALDVNALRWCEMSSGFCIFSILFDLKPGIQFVKHKTSFTVFSKIWVRDYTLQTIAWKPYISVYVDIIYVYSNAVVWM